ICQTTAMQISYRSSMRNCTISKIFRCNFHAAPALPSLEYLDRENPRWHSARFTVKHSAAIWNQLHRLPAGASAQPSTHRWRSSTACHLRLPWSSVPPPAAPAQMLVQLPRYRTPYACYFHAQASTPTKFWTMPTALLVDG